MYSIPGNDLKKKQQGVILEKDHTFFQLNITAEV